ncbi:MAG: type VI secretion system tube protein Hcp [Planctomycetota bacterium]
MASGAYMRIKGFDPGIREKHSFRDGWLPVESLAFAYGSSDPRGGKQTGRRIHDTVKVTKFIDSTEPLILRALCMSEIDELEFRFRGSVRKRDGKKPILRCRVGKAVVVRRKVRRSPKGGSGTDLGTGEYLLRCTDLVVRTED